MNTQEIKLAVDAFFAASSGIEDPEAIGCFNSILEDGVFTKQKPRVFIGDFDEAQRAHRVAAVLLGIANEPQMKAGGHNKEPFGWKALNKDAQEWCKNMIECLPPKGMSDEAIRELLMAKSLVGSLVADLLVNVPRDPPYLLNRGDVLTRKILDG